MLKAIQLNHKLDINKDIHPTNTQILENGMEFEVSEIGKDGDGLPIYKAFEGYIFERDGHLVIICNIEYEIYYILDCQNVPITRVSFIVKDI